MPGRAGGQASRATLTRRDSHSMYEEHDEHQRTLRHQRPRRPARRPRDGAPHRLPRGGCSMSLPPWHAEIVELHDFFQEWLGGTLPATDEAYARLVDTQAP